MKLQIDNTPLMTEIFKTQAYVRTLASVLLTAEQKEKFDQKFGENFKEVISEFLESFPDSIENVEELKKSIS